MNKKKIRKDIKIIYFFQQQTLRHFNVYAGYCVEFAKKCCNTEILSFFPFRNYCKNFRKIRKFHDKYRTNHLQLSLVPTFRNSKQIQLVVKLFFNQLRYREVIIIARKIDYTTLEFIKNKFPQIILIYESEGDAISEYNFIRKYDKALVTDSREVIFERNKKIFELVDKVVAGTKSMATLLKMRYPCLDGKVSFVIPTFSREKFFFDQAIREKKRAELGIKQKKVYIYTGSVLYAWQNYRLNIKIFKEILKTSEQSIFISLVPYRDIVTAKKLLAEEKIDESKFIVATAENDEVAEYLMAADMAFIIRHIHTMNYIAPTAKTGEYLATGLPLIYTRALSLYNAFITERSYGIIEYDSKNFFNRIEEIIGYTVDANKRKEISKQAADNFSFEANSSQYIKIIKDIVINK